MNADTKVVLSCLVAYKFLRKNKDLAVLTLALLKAVGQKLEIVAAGRGNWMFGQMGGHE
jgi:hypothetical protein